MRKRIFPISTELTQSQREAGMRRVLQDGMLSQAMASLTGSAILVAFAVEMGASNAVIGFLAAIPQLAQLIQLPAIQLIRRFKNRRAINVIVSSLGRLSWVALSVGILMHAASTQLLNLLVVVLLFSSIMAAIANCGWNSWMHDLIPHNSLGSFFGRRFSLATSVSLVVSLAAAWFLDHNATIFVAHPLSGYALVFLVAVCFGMAGVFYVARIPEPQYVPTGEPILDEIRKPFQEKNFRNLIHFLGAWQFAMYLATPFFAVYMLRRLEMELLWVIGLIAMGRVVNIVFLRLWGSFADLSSYKSVLGVCTPLCLLCIIGWTFTTFPEKHFLTVPLLIGLHLLMGIAMAGITLATGNIGLKLAPLGAGTSYLAAVSFVGALTAGLAPAFSGYLVDFFLERKLSWIISYSSPNGEAILSLLDFQQWDFLFFLSFLIGLYAVHRLTLVVEQGEISERMVIGELIGALGRELRDFSTVSTIRNIVNLVPVGVEKKKAVPTGKTDPTSSG